jgi:hypothetical protein
MNRPARRATFALETADLAAFCDRWTRTCGGDHPETCHLPARVEARHLLGTYADNEHAARTRVSEVTVVGDRILVGSAVAGTHARRQRGGHAARRQVLIKHGRRVVDIVGIDQRSEVITHSAVPAMPVAVMSGRRMRDR